MKHFVILFFISICISIKSQSIQKIDSINNLDYTFVSNNLKLCEKLYQKNIFHAQKLKYQKGIADAYFKLALTYSLLAEYDKSIEIYMKALKIYEKLKNYENVARIYADIGYRIRYVDLNEGIRYFRKAIFTGKKYKIGYGLSPIYNNYGEVIKNLDIDSAIYFFNLSKDLCIKFKDSIGLPFSLNKLAESYAKKRNFKLAFTYLNQSDKIRFHKLDSAGIADNIAYRADIFYEVPEIDSAIFYYEKSLILAIKTKYNSLERFCLERLADLFKRKKDFEKALKYHIRFKNLEDSVLNLGVKNEIANLQIEFDTEKTKRELAENQIKLANRQRLLIIGLGLTIILILSFWFIYRFQKSKKQNQLKELVLQNELNQTKLEKSFVDEKIRIARELHDNIGSHLTFMISSLDNLMYLKNPEKNMEKINDLSNFGRATMKDLRDTIWAMNHEDGTIEMLLTRISELRSVLPNYLQVSMLVEANKNIPLNGIQMLNLYRIVQEFIQNTIKYADATEIDVKIEIKNEKLCLTLKDNGKGFDLDKINFGNGILNMKRRCSDLFGEFNIQSNDKGTEINCLIPLHKNN